MDALIYAVRSLRRSPRFVAVVVLTLALGIGANTAIFSVVHSMILSPLPFRDSSRLVFVWSDMTSSGYPRAPLSGPEVMDLRTRSSRFTDFGGIWATSATLTPPNADPQQLRTGLVTTNFFSVLGADAARGRTFTADDETSGASAIVLSWPLWQQQFGGDTNVVGRSLVLNGRPSVVIGVMPRDFLLLMPPDAAVPDDLDAWTLLPNSRLAGAPRGQQYLRVIGRMKLGVTLAQGRQDIDRVATEISRAFTDYAAEGRHLTTVGLQTDSVRLVRPMLIGLFSGVAILLLIACVNVAGLLVVRTVSRTRETAVKLCLGVGRSRLIHECFAEGLVLASLGLVAGVAVGYAALRLLVSARPSGLDRLAATHINLPVLAFSGVVAGLCGVFFSLAPSSELLRTNLAGVLQREGRRGGGGARSRVRGGLVIAQVALSVVLLVAASLMYRTFTAIKNVNPGFSAQGVLSFKVNPRGRSIAEINAFSRTLQTRFAALPHVTGVGSVSHMPYDNVPNWGGPYLATSDNPRVQQSFADYRSVSPGFFETVGARLIEGRSFTEDDDERAALVVVVDEQLAKRAWPNASAVGREIALDPQSAGSPTTKATVVGVVAHLRLRSVLETLNDQVYFPARQVLRSPYAFVVHTTGNPLDLVAGVRGVVRDVAPQLAVAAVRPLDEYVLGARAANRFAALLAVTFAVVALLLSSIGLFGVVAYATAQRTSEFGIRLALGARPHSVRALVLREALVLGGAGLGLGLIAATIGTRFLRSLLYGISATDAMSYGAAIVVIASATIIASWLPALRAGRISPMAAIQTE